MALLEVRIDRDYDGNDARLLIQAGNAVGAIPLLSPTTARPDYGLIVQPRFPWAGIGPMLAEMGWRVSPTPLRSPLLHRSERRVPPWVLSFALYVLVAATGMRISEALALESKHFVNNCRTIQVYQQVDRDHPRIVEYVKTDAGFREVDLYTSVGEYLQGFISRKDGLLFETRNGTPYVHNNLEQRWLTPRLEAMGSDERGMGFHASRRFRKTWLRGKRVQEDINNFWMGHVPETMSETYSRLDLELDLRLVEAESMGAPFRPSQLLQVAPRFRKNRVSNWFCNFSRIK